MKNTYGFDLCGVSGRSVTTVSRFTTGKSAASKTGFTNETAFTEPWAGFETWISASSESGGISPRFVSSVGSRKRRPIEKSPVKRKRVRDGSARTSGSGSSATSPSETGRRSSTGITSRRNPGAVTSRSAFCRRRLGMANEPSAPVVALCSCSFTVAPATGAPAASTKRPRTEIVESANAARASFSAGVSAFPGGTYS